MGHICLLSHIPSSSLLYLRHYGCSVVNVTFLNKKFGQAVNSFTHHIAPFEAYFQALLGWSTVATFLTYISLIPTALTRLRLHWITLGVQRGLSPQAIQYLKVSQPCLSSNSCSARCSVFSLMPLVIALCPASWNPALHVSSLMFSERPRADFLQILEH